MHLSEKNVGPDPGIISFSLRNNHKIYITAKLNGTDVSNIQLDRGRRNTLSFGAKHKQVG